MGTAYAAITIFHTPLGGTQRNVGAAIGTLTAWIETKAMNIGEDRLSYFIDQINSHVTDSISQTLLLLEIYGSDKEDGPFDLLDTISLAREDPGYTDPPGARYYKFKFIDSAVRSRWQLHGFDVYGEPGGDEF